MCVLPLSTRVIRVGRGGIGVANAGQEGMDDLDDEKMCLPTQLAAALLKRTPCSERSQAKK